LVDWKSTLVPVIPAEAESRRFWNLNRKMKLDADVRRHDGLSLRLKAASSDVVQRMEKLLSGK
jgi:hypothetical protein